MYNIDDLSCNMEVTIEKRKQFIGKAENIIEGQTIKLQTWYDSLDIQKLITNMKGFYSNIAEKHAEKYSNGFGHEEQDYLKEFALSLMNKFLYAPISFIKKESLPDATNYELKISDIAQKMLMRDYPLKNEGSEK